MTCPHCDNPTDEHDVFCGACGAYLERGAEPAVFRKVEKFAAFLPVLKWFQRLMVLILIFYGLILLYFWYMNVYLQKPSMVGIEWVMGCVVAMCLIQLGSALLLLWLQFKWRCPGCRAFLIGYGHVWKQQNAMFCGKCGMRLSAGVGQVMPPQTPEPAAVLERCRCCGEIRRDVQSAFCVACGASLRMVSRADLWGRLPRITLIRRLICRRCNQRNGFSILVPKAPPACCRCGTSTEPDESGEPS